MTAREIIEILRQWAWQYRDQQLSCLLDQEISSSHGRPKMIRCLAELVDSVLINEVN